MGVVFKAWDTRLERDVAIKILHAEPVADDSHSRRLLAEGRAASCLNHPNILRVYDAAVDGSLFYLVSEWLEGKSVRSELRRGALPLKRLLDLAVQIADGLAAAHAMGVVHRDIKPENVMLAGDGTARIVDFGLARAERRAGAGDEAGLPSETISLEGGVAGTPAYMSPEQARGTLGDFRTDQFSFGTMLYEMATGVRPFRRNTTAETLTAILHDEASPLVAQNPRVPAPFAWIVEQCLAKDPAERYAATEDLARELRRVRERLRETAAEHKPEHPARRVGAMAVMAAVGVGAIGTLLLIGVPAEGPELRFTPIASAADYEGTPVWSRDGQSLAWVADIDGVLQLFVRRLTDAVATQVTRGRFDAEEPFWSADGRALYFISAGGDALALWTVGATGGRPELLIENVNHAALDPTGRRLAVLRTDTALDQQLWWASVDGSGLSLEQRPPFDRHYGVGGQLQFRPDGQYLLAWVFSPGAIGESSSSAYYLVPIAADRPVTEVLKHIGVTANLPSFSWLPDNRHVAMGVADTEGGRRHLWIADTRSTAMRRLTSTHVNETWPAASPDGRRLAYASEDVDFDLVAIAEDGRLQPKPLATARNEMDPAWSPDGDQYAFITDRSGEMDIWMRSRDGQWERPVVSGRDFSESRTDTFGSLALSPDGRTLAYHRRSNVDASIWMTPVTGGTPVKLVLDHSPYNFQDAPSWSADGEWIAFVGARGSEFELAKARIGTRETVKLLGDVMPFTRAVWSPDGRWIVCEITTGLAKIPSDGGAAQLVLEERLLAYTWLSDSRRVVALQEGEATGHIAVIEIDTTTGQTRTLNPDLATIPIANQPIRGFSYIKGQGLITSLAAARSDIWLLDGVELPGNRWLRWFRR